VAVRPENGGTTNRSCQFQQQTGQCRHQQTDVQFQRRGKYQQRNVCSQSWCKRQQNGVSQ